ncbi:unnamed protein product [Caenorhabditis angaria]|uniref:Uncharacterized protein n=1 Tax=Caenorhabditis angaria TaxID=860376 RepID=A0A9P1IRV2_9PELO|nr:unnamed protein product [Caenorhabditis angaria]
MFYLLIHLISIVFASEKVSISITDYCESEKFSDWIVREFKLDKFPTKVYLSFNHCCAVHDDCYHQSLGKEWCDKNFERCSSLMIEQVKKYSILSNSRISRFGTLQKTTHFSKEHYNPQKSDNDEYAPVSYRKIGKIYPVLFKYCRTQISTFSSCAFRFDECVFEDIVPIAHCKIYLDFCLHSSREQRDQDYACDCAVRAVQLSIDVPANLPSNNQSIVRENSMSFGLLEFA